MLTTTTTTTGKGKKIYKNFGSKNAQLLGQAKVKTLVRVAKEKPQQKEMCTYIKSRDGQATTMRTTELKKKEKQSNNSNMKSNMIFV